MNAKAKFGGPFLPTKSEGLWDNPVFLHNRRGFDEKYRIAEVLHDDRSFYFGYGFSR